jgi:hypothetical protein
VLIPPLTTIDLDTFETACLSFISLTQVDVPEGGTILDVTQEVEYAVEDFATWVSDNFDREPAVRYALAYLLNLDDGRFAAEISQLEIHFPVRGDYGTLQRFFVMLWDGTFADWRIPRFDPDGYDVARKRSM